MALSRETSLILGRKGSDQLEMILSLQQLRRHLAVQRVVKKDRNPQPQDYMSVCEINYLFKAILLQLLELKAKKFQKKKKKY